MSIGILACESLLEYVEAAQEKLGTEYPVFVLDYSGDESPQQMRSRIIGITMLLPAEMDTVLVAMGFCGGSWNQLSFDRRVVIPRAVANTDDASSQIQSRHRWKVDSCYQ